MLVEDQKLDAIVKLPGGVFKPYAGVKTSVLVFQRPTEPAVNIALNRFNQRRPVWFYEIKNDGYDPDKVSGGGRVETPNENGIPALLEAWASYKAGALQNPPGPEANTLLEADAEEPTCWWATIDRLADSGYSLSAATYKPTIPTRTNAEDPKALIDDLLKIEKSIVSGLDSLRSAINL